MPGVIFFATTKYPHDILCKNFCPWKTYVQTLYFLIPGMLIRLLDSNALNAKNLGIYSIGVVEEIAGENTYRVRLKDSQALLYTRGQLELKAWIRFIGVFDGTTIRCTYIENLQHSDVPLILKWVEKLAACGSE